MYEHAQNEIPPRFMSAMADKLSVLAHPHRLRIIEILDLWPESTVNEIAQRADLNPPTASRHLGTMRRAELLGRERNGQQVHYRITNQDSLVILNCIRKMQ